VAEDWFRGEREETKDYMKAWLELNPKHRLGQLINMQKYTEFKDISPKEFLEKEITVYRGIGAKEYDIEAAKAKTFESFTLSREKAIDFVERYSNKGDLVTIVEARIKVIDILGFNNTMSEKEVFVDVNKVKDLTIKKFIR